MVQRLRRRSRNLKVPSSNPRLHVFFCFFCLFLFRQCKNIYKYNISVKTSYIRKILLEIQIIYIMIQNYIF